MTRKNVLMCFILLLAVCDFVNAQDIPADLYKASTLPDSLKQDANSVVRYAMEEYVVKGPGRAVNKMHTVTTILNEKDDNEAVIQVPYDKKFNSISRIEMIAYDADGKLIKKYKRSDMYDGAATDGISIVTDNRFLAARHTITSYPVTIEITVEVNMNSYLDLGAWYIQKPDQAVQNSVCKVTAPSTVGFRYLNKNTKVQPVKTNADGNEVYTWSVKNLKAIKPEEDVPAWKVSQRIFFNTNNFEFDGRPGDISSWQNYGKWYQTLNADVNSLSPQRAEEIRQMTANLKTDKEKAKFLYEYLQQNMRYVSIQLGIGGLKPFPAMFVDQKKYGDCKALSNYMGALLKAVNIPSYYAIIYGGENGEPAEPSFPSDPFNHIVLCVPFKGDTTWLECTSNTQPFGKLGNFTENRNALLITENGGVLVNTPKSKAEDNQFKSEVHVKLSADGSAKAEVKIMGTGEYRSDYIGVTAMKTDDQKEFFQRVMNIKQPSAFEFKATDDKDGTKELNIELEYDKLYDIASGNKQFYRPRIFDIWRYTCPVLEKRRSDYYFSIPMQKVCNTVIDLPEGFEVETLPANQSLKFTYGNYDVTYSYDAAKNQVNSVTKFNLNSHIIPAAKYTEMQQYMDAIAKAQNKKLVIKRKA
ncbi:hypothetical protein GCM10023149_34400 [Mucilaginibacter gynuensis]|uniref:DUF3857 domain-containing protein n=1 Tax=Mucilaginibacter gynuensis TaxID=1302236 RepID=A0ABP8GTY8_9SPHI